MIVENTYDGRCYFGNETVLRTCRTQNPLPKKVRQYEAWYRALHVFLLALTESLSHSGLKNSVTKKAGVDADNQRRSLLFSIDTSLPRKTEVGAKSAGSEADWLGTHLQSQERNEVPQNNTAQIVNPPYNIPSVHGHPTSAALPRGNRRKATSAPPTLHFRRLRPLHPKIRTENSSESTCKNSWFI